MTKPWKVVMHHSQIAIRILAHSPTHGDLLKARLPPQIHHPRALLTLFEGLALWSGKALHVAVVADDRCHPLYDLHLFGDERFPGQSALVHYHAVELGPPCISGMGSFAHLRNIAPFSDGSDDCPF